MRPLPQPDRAAHLAELTLRCDIAQEFPWRATEALLSIARGDTGIDPADARQILHAALQACITAEILADREAAR